MEPGIKILKLITGETIMADIEYDKLKKNATLNYPLIFHVQYKPTGSVSMVATRWVESNVVSHKIKTHHIVVAADPTEIMEELYMDSIEDLENYDNYEYEQTLETKTSEKTEIDDFISSMSEMDETIVH